MPAQDSGRQPHYLSALTGVRFFAIFHIFLFHLWVLYDLEKAPQVETLMSDFGQLPPMLIRFLSHGWLSTSFFFVLSGFIQGYLYWSPSGQLSVDRKRFIGARLSRIYPIHLIVLLITALIIGTFVFSNNDNWVLPIVSFFATATLMQSWVPQLVPVWSWPTWTISTLLFLYLITPWLMVRLHRLSRRQQVVLLLCLPLLSLVPTFVFALFFPPGAQPSQNWQIFIGSTPLFWIAHYVAGMLLSRVFQVSRFSDTWKPARQRWISLGDIALVVWVAIALLPGIEEEPYKYFFRHGLLMPLYLIFILDLAKHHGVAARLFSLPGTGFLGETGYAIFIWQNLIMVFCWFSVSINPAAGQYHLLAATIGALVLGVVSTYWIEKPLARKLRTRFWATPD